MRISDVRLPPIIQGYFDQLFSEEAVRDVHLSWWMEGFFGIIKIMASSIPKISSFVEQGLDADTVATMKKRNPASVLIVDDHPMVREGLAGRIAGEAGLEVCGEAADMDEALEQVKQLRPDLVIVDISLKTSHGVDLIKRLKSGGPAGTRPKVLVHTMYTESLYADRALQAGADGYITKQEAPEQVLEAIRQILDGKVYLSPEMNQRVLSRAVGRPSDEAAPSVDKLSDRELEVFRLIGEGATTGEIANRLHLSTHTIDTHRENIKRKLELKNAAELNRAAVQWVLENG